MFLLTCSKVQTPLIYYKNDQSIGRSNRKVLIVGWDGVRTDALKIANTHHLFALTKESTYSWDVDRGPHTVSVPGWSTLLHGVWPKKHGLTVNSFNGNNYLRYPDLFTLLKGREPTFVCANLSNWDQFLNITSLQNISIEVNSDQELTNQTIKLISEQAPDVTVLHYNEPDFQGHRSGFSIDNRNYIDAIAQSDRYLGTLMQVVADRERRLGEEWMLVITTDHGGSNEHHENQDENKETRYVWCVIRTPNGKKLDLTKSSVNLVDILPTIFQWLNIPVDENWELDGKCLSEQFKEEALMEE